MKKTIAFLILFIMFLGGFSLPAGSTTLKAGISLSDSVPTGFFGSWKITSVMIDSTNPKMFNETSKDFWNLSKSYDVITLSNPFSGAEASVTVEDVKNNQIKFSHVSKSKDAKMIETPTITLEGDSFYGTDEIIVEKYKNGTLVSKDMVTYRITAEKVSSNAAKALEQIFMSGK